MKDKIKIGIVCYPTYGGSGVVATELGVALSKKKYEVHFISYDQPFRLDLFSEKIYYHEVSVPQYPLFEYTPYELNLTSKLVDVAINEGLDLLHVHYAIPHASAAISAKQILSTQDINLPIVTTLHGTDITLLGKDASFKPVIEFAINMSDIVTVVSKDLKKMNPACRGSGPKTAVYSCELVKPRSAPGPLTQRRPKGRGLLLSLMFGTRKV